MSLFIHKNYFHLLAMNGLSILYRPKSSNFDQRIGGIGQGEHTRHCYQAKDDGWHEEQPSGFGHKGLRRSSS